MRTNPLLPLLRSQAQARLLAELYLHPDREYSLTELADVTSVSVKTIHTEAERLTGGGFVHSRKVGNVRMLRASLDHRLAEPLTELLLRTYGPEPVMRDLLSTVEEVEHAYIFGSWAARFRGLPGGIPRDLDVLVVGAPDKDVVYDISEQAAGELSMDVNIQVVRPDRWAADDDVFLRQVREGALVELDLHAAGGTETR